MQLPPEFRHRGLRFPVLGILLFTAVWLLTSSLPAETLPARCPALDMLDAGMRGRELGGIDDDDAGPPTLVIVGTVRGEKAGAAQVGKVIQEVEIEQTLYGHWPKKTVRISSQWKSEDRRIFFLTRSDNPAGVEFQLRDSMEVEDSAMAKALCAARLATLALGAECIVVGEPVAGPGSREVRVLSVVHGDLLQKGEKFPLVPLPIGTSIAVPKPGLYPGPHLYFVRTRIEPKAGGPVGYGFLGILPVETEPAIRQALALRDSFPVVEDPRYSEFEGGPKFREVLFGGDVPGALELLSSWKEGFKLFGQRYLLHHAAEARAPLQKKIAESMLRTDVTKGRDYGIQEEYIDMLAQLERKTPTGALAELVWTLLGQIEAAPAIPLPERDESRAIDNTPGGKLRIPEENMIDVNHSLTWLLSAMDDAEIAAKVERRILELQPRLQGWWRQEVDLAIATADVDQNRQLRDALPRMAGVKPIRSAPGLRHTPGDGVKTVAVSADGTLLATSGGHETRVWSLTDWRCLSVIPKEGDQLTFSPDGKSLYLSHPGQTGEIFFRYDWRTAKLEQTYWSKNAWIARMQLSRDGATMLTASYMDRTLILWDTATGEKLRTESLPSLSTAVALDPDGVRVARQVKFANDTPNGSSATVVESKDGKEVFVRLAFDFQVGHHAFTSNGRYLVASGTAGANLRLDVYDFATKRTQTIASDAYVHHPSKFAVSSQGRFAVVGDEEGRIKLYDITQARLRWAMQLPHQRGVDSFAFSADEKLLFVASGRSSPYVLQTEKLEDVMPYDGHPVAIEDIHFSADGQRLWSIGRDGTVCHWDAATMKMTKRFPAPAGFDLISVRPKDGRYLLFGEERDYSTPAKPRKSLVMDAETGAIVSTLGLTLDFRGVFIWLPEGELITLNRAIADGDATVRVNFMQGKVVSRAPYNLRTTDGIDVYLASDQNSLLVLGPGEPPDRVDLLSGKVTHPAVVGEGNTRALDGLSYRWVAGETPAGGVSLVRRYETEQVLSADGTRLAVVTGAPSDAVARAAPAPPTIRIHDAATRAMICAFPASTSKAKVRFNVDATQLAVINDDGTIECWRLPAPGPKQEEQTR